MSPRRIFISHASADDGFVKELRVFLERLRLPVWVDSRNLRGGDKLLPEIRKAIEQARQVIGVFSPQTVNSGWVRREIQWAEKVAKRRQGDGYAVIPILLPGIEPSRAGLVVQGRAGGRQGPVGSGRSDRRGDPCWPRPWASNCPTTSSRRPRCPRRPSKSCA